LINQPVITYKPCQFNQILSVDNSHLDYNGLD
jgi:hypothetical protein